MPCIVVSLPSGERTLMHTAAQRLLTCHFCRQQPAVKLCDYPVKTGDVGHTRTCDAALCNHCAIAKGKNRDYCPVHAEFPL
jgi:hypothetical protein